MALIMLDTKGNQIPWNLEEWIRTGEPMNMDELRKKVIVLYRQRYGDWGTVAKHLKITERTLFRMKKKYNIQ